MNSAGQNTHLRKVTRQSLNQDRENVRPRESTNKENVQPVPVTKSKYSTDALLRISQPSSSRYSTGSSSCNARNARQPLLDVNVNKRQRFEDSKQPPPVTKSVKPTGAVVRRTIFLNEKPGRSTNYDPYIPSSTPGPTEITSKQVHEKPNPDDSQFWTSFLTVDHTVNGPHKKVQKFSQNVVQQPKTFSCTYIIHDSIPSLKKKTLKKHVSNHSGYLGVVNLDPNSNPVNPAVLYSCEFINDVIYNIICKQAKNVLKSRFLDKSSTFLDSRASVINWLVKLHQYFPSEPAVFFMSVRMFDKILTLIDIPGSNYQLIAMTTFWIAMKYVSSSVYISGSKLVNLCNNAFTLNCLLEMERNVLLILQFDIIVDDPIIFTNYYIYLLQLYDSNNVGFCATYLLEILTLDFNCNTYSLSLQAASAVFLSIKFFNINDNVWRKMEKFFAHHNVREMFPLHKIMIKNIILVNHEDCPYKESLQKYSTEKYGKVSLFIPKVLEKWYNVNDISRLIL